MRRKQACSRGRFLKATLVILVVQPCNLFSASVVHCRRCCSTNSVEVLESWSEFLRRCHSAKRRRTHSTTLITAPFQIDATDFSLIHTSLSFIANANSIAQATMSSMYPTSHFDMPSTAPAGSRRTSASFVPLQTKTRAMSRQPSVGHASTSRLPLPSGLKSTSTKSRILRKDSRQPLRESLPNAAAPLMAIGGKRKASDEWDRPTKMLKVVSHIAAESDPVTPKKQSGVGLGLGPAPTPARVLLQQGIRQTSASAEEDEDEDEEMPVVPRPPTPPRVRDRVAGVAADALPDHGDQMMAITPKRSLTPDDEAQPARNVSRLDVLPSSPSGPSTPRRVLPGLSRLGLSPSPRTTSTTGPATAAFSSAALIQPRPPLPKAKITVPQPFSSRVSAPTKVSGNRERPTVQRVPSGPKVPTPATASTSSSTAGSDTTAQAAATATPRTSLMPPPSSLPLPKPRASVSGQPTSLPLAKSTASSLSSLPVRRPTSRPSFAAAIDPDKENTPTPPAEAPLRRKPSYPSSLGSGPHARPTPRVVSSSMGQLRAVTQPLAMPKSTTTDEEIERPAFPPKSPRSVSAPVPRVTAGPRLSLSMSQRREGIYGDASKTLNGLNDALSKLKMQLRESASSAHRPRQSLPAPRSSYEPVILVDQHSEPSHHATVRVAAVHRPRQSLAVPPSSLDISMTSDEGDVADRSLAGLLCSTSGGGCLKGVRAFVDVHTDDGADSSGIFIDMLKSLGARVSPLNVSEIS